MSLLRVIAALLGSCLLVLGWSAALAQAAQPANTQAQPKAEADAGTIQAVNQEQQHGADAGHAEDVHSDAHGAAAGGHAVPSPVAGDPDLMIFTLIIFLILLGVLGKFAWGPIVEGLDKREQGIAANIAAAQKSNEDAKALLAEYERKLATAPDQVRAILDEARRDAEHTQQEILAGAKADSQAERERALREIETAKAGALKELAEQSANLAVDLAGKILRSHLSAADHSRLIEEAVSKFPQGSPSNN